MERLKNTTGIPQHGNGGGVVMPRHRLRAVWRGDCVGRWRGFDCGEDCPADQFGNLGNYGVSEGFKSVCPVGNPISHSTHVGFNAPDVSETTCESINCLPINDRRLTAGEPRFPLSLSSEADGVGQRLRATSRSRLGNFALAVFSVKFAAIALQLRGVGHFNTSERYVSPRLRIASLLPIGDAVGVCNNPDPIAAVVGTKAGSWYAMPFRIIPERGQGSENRLQPSRKQRADVLQDNETGSQFANKTGDLVEQAATLAFKPCPKPCEANVLAWEAAADDIDANPIGSKPCAGKFSDIGVTGDVWPMLGEDAAGEVFNFAEGDRFKATRSFKAKAKSSNAGKQVKHPQFVRTGEAGYKAAIAPGPSACGVGGHLGDLCLCEAGHLFAPAWEEVAIRQFQQRDEGEAHAEQADHANRGCASGDKERGHAAASLAASNASAASNVRLSSGKSPVSKRETED